MKVLGLGDNVVDKYVHLHTMYPGGNALNFSVYAKQLGVESSYMGTFGSDTASDHIQAVLAQLGIEKSRCRQVEGENGYALVTVQDGDRVFAGSNNGGVQKDHKLVLSVEDLKYLRGFDLIHTSYYSYIEAELDKIKTLGIPISFDFSDEFTDADIERISPYVRFSFLSCSHLKEDEVIDLVHKVYSYGSEIVVATRGAEGALLFDGHNLYRQKPNLVEAIDTLGAGDSFITAFLLNYLEPHIDNKRDHIHDCLAKAAEFAAMNCMVDGAFGHGLKY
jgi:fructoselysine 6-kinase